MASTARGGTNEHLRGRTPTDYYWLNERTRTSCVLVASPSATDDRRRRYPSPPIARVPLLCSAPATHRRATPALHDATRHSGEPRAHSRFFYTCRNEKLFTHYFLFFLFPSSLFSSVFLSSLSLFFLFFFLLFFVLFVKHSTEWYIQALYALLRTSFVVVLNYEYRVYICISVWSNETRRNCISFHEFYVERLSLCHVNLW